MARSNITSPVMLELLRAQMQSIAEQAADTVMRTAISPVVNEAKDCGTVILDRDGNLITGGGMATIHWVGATRAIRATIARYGDSIGPEDVYLANDPYNGGGMHPADIMVQRPIFIDGERVAWAAISGHMMDMGGMSVGSWSPQATECYQEALRIPPVRLIKGGKDVGEVWDLLRVNIRFFSMVEMDIRCFVAGTFTAQQRLAELIGPMGVEDFKLGVRTLIELSERELRRRISLLEPGEYRTVGWTEWGEKFIATPCRLTVAGDTLVFDFEGAHPQVPFFINTQPYVIKTHFMPQLIATLAPDLPFNEGVLKPVELLCPEGTVVYSTPPAPMNCAHMHLSGTAAEAMYRCLRLAVWATRELADSVPAMGAEGYCALSTNSWFGKGHHGEQESWMMTDGTMTGGCAFRGSDGTDFTMKSLDLPLRDLSSPCTLDVETYETWFPMLLRDRRTRHGVYGAGRWRSGGAMSHSFEPYGTDEIVGQMLGERAYLPLIGEAGGAPGAVTRIVIHRPDGTSERIAMAAADVVLRAGEVFEVDCASAGGWGDPLERDPSDVAEDMRNDKLAAEDAAAAYGVVIMDGSPDLQKTAKLREDIKQRRLASARAAAHPQMQGRPMPQDEAFPLYPGVVQRGPYAYAQASGALLAAAPRHWTEGCPVLEIENEAYGPSVIQRIYLDPLTGTSLYMEVVPKGHETAFVSLPARWTSQVPLAAE